MTKNKNFKDWVNEDYRETEYYDEESRFKKKDSKRYDRKKTSIQKARKRKNKMKNSYIDGI